MIFVIKRNDTSPGLQRTLSRADDSVVDLTGAAVRFHMKNSAGEVQVDAPAQIFGDATGGVVRYAWAAADTDTAGQFDAEFEVTFLDGGIESFPNQGFLKIIIDPDIT